MESRGFEMGKSPWIPRARFLRLCRASFAYTAHKPGYKQISILQLPFSFKRGIPERGRRVLPHPTLEDYDDA